MTDQTTGSETLDLHDFEPAVEDFRREAVDGLSQAQKILPAKYLYDERGSQIFDAICELPEYYPTRTEISIMRTHGDEMAEALGTRCLLIEYGSGSSLKTRLLLDVLRDPAAYVPLDISREHLAKSAEDLAAAYPGLEVLPVCADYTADFDLPEPTKPAKKRVVSFPGSTIGNLHRPEAIEFLRHVHDVVGAAGGLLIGVDLKKDIARMEAAYNDAAGVTADFNYNLLARLQRELHADLDPDGFLFRATWNDDEGRIESHLISRRQQTITIGGHEFPFAEGETIRTECSYKFTLEDFAQLAAEAGFTVERVWMDEDRLFSVQYLVRR